MALPRYQQKSRRTCQHRIEEAADPPALAETWELAAICELSSEWAPNQLVFFSYSLLHMSVSSIHSRNNPSSHSAPLLTFKEDRFSLFP